MDGRKCILLLIRNSHHAIELAGGREYINPFITSYECLFYPRTAISGLNYKPSAHILNLAQYNYELISMPLYKTYKNQITDL
jgi:hypothetical protein